MASKSALVFGGAGALGRAFVKDLVANSWKVICVDFVANDEASQNVTLSFEESWKAQGDKVKSELSKDSKKLSLVVCAAGAFEMEGIADDAVFAHMDKLLGANLKSATLTAHIAAHHLEDDGLLVLTGAKAALEPTGWAIAYGMTKAATHHLIQSVAADPKFPATVAGILPITIDTPQNRKSMPDADFSTWTQPSEIAAHVRGWTNENAPASGSFWEIKTTAGKTEFLAVSK